MLVPPAIDKTGALAADPAGAETTAARIMSESPAVLPVATVIAEVAVYVTPVRPDGCTVVIAPSVTVLFAIAALAGTTDSIPTPNADTATSAIRLIDVFVDICFLS